MADHDHSGIFALEFGRGVEAFRIAPFALTIGAGVLATDRAECGRMICTSRLGVSAHYTCSVLQGQGSWLIE